MAHPGQAHKAHAVFYAVPDIAFALLAVEGLAYLISSRFTDKIQQSTVLRSLLLFASLGFGVAVIVVNAIEGG